LWVGWAWQTAHACGRDAPGQLTSSADPLDGQTHTYGYSPLTQLTSDQRSSGGTTSWTPDGASQITQRVDPTGPATSTLSYDAASELSSLHTVSGTTTTRNLTLSYNADGDRTRQSDSVSGASSYGYDQEDRLITATTGLTQSSYAYDGNGLRQRLVKRLKQFRHTATRHEKRAANYRGLLTWPQFGSGCEFGNSRS
jgi:YD repeat-containing protein